MPPPPVPARSDSLATTAPAFRCPFAAQPADALAGVSCEACEMRVCCRMLSVCLIVKYYSKVDNTMKTFKSSSNKKPKNGNV